MLRWHRAARPIAALPGSMKSVSTILPLSYAVRESKVDRAKSFSSVLHPWRGTKCIGETDISFDRRKALAHS